LIAPPCVVAPRLARHVPIVLSGSGVTYPWRFDQTELRTALDHVVREHRPDRALVWAGAEPLWFGRSELPPAVVDVIDCNPLEFCRGFLSYSDLRQRLRALRELPVATRCARSTVRSYAATITVGEADARWLRYIGGRNSVHVVPNGVDLPPLDTIPGEASQPTLCLTGALDYQPNIEAVLFAVKAIWPRVHSEMPYARFVIAGRNPVPAVSALAGQANIEVAADVPEMTAVLGRSWVALAPMRSGVGIKNKVLEAWACARPVVMTPLATNGLTVPDDHRALVTGAAESMARLIVAILRDPDRRNRLGRSARQTVQTHFTWAAAADRINALLRQ
jgi:glycosyltransferase involved in cell wall biosynthesis